MKNSLKILAKIFAILMFLYITPFYDGLQYMFKDGFMSNLVYHQRTISQDLSLKSQLNVLSYNSNITIARNEIDVETTSEEPMIIPKTVEKEDKSEQSPKKNGKKIYIYNTHQDEKYSDGKTVMDAAVILAKHLKKEGFEVILETNDFVKYRDEHNLTYNDAYTVSNKYLNDALVNYNGFDLCIDLHRDSVPRSASYKTIGNKTYAKAMMVVAGSSSNVTSATKISTSLTDNVNKYKNGIMKSVMTRKEAYYNQFVHKGIVLMECGSDNNSFKEVSNTLEIVAKAITDTMK